ncbi:lantibiotic dehydratase [Nocardiopsis rhodophaea]|uniref:lantibiotic dehydratase n=1 Tax=Nocardiopsis rhodophaea TaxID=280238 RepID=UPI0031DDBEFF
MHPRFTAQPDALLRASAFVGPQDLPPLPDVPIGEGEHLQAWVRWLRQVRDHPQLAEAIADASPTLAQSLDAVCHSGKAPREVARVARSCARYVLRARSRATPFGLFAGIAPLTYASTVAGSIGADHRPMARLSAAWISAAVARLESCCTAFAAQLRLMANDLAVVRQGRVVLDHQPLHGTDRTTCASVRYTPQVALVLEQTRTPMSRRNVERALARAFPGHDEAARRMVDELVRHRILLSSLHPPMDTPDPLGHLIAAARDAEADRHPASAELLAHLTNAQRALQRHDTAGAADRQRARAQAHIALRRLAPDQARVTLDLRLDSDLVLPRTVAWQAQAAASVLARLNPAPEGTAAWRDYHHRFRERYGVGALVPVGELIDPDRGLGLPAGFRGSRLPIPPAEALSERDAALMDLAQRATVHGRREVVLDEQTLERLGAADPPALWPHTELRAQVYAPTRRALDEGDFEVVVDGVSRAAGTTTGRVLDLLTPGEYDRLTAPYRRLPTLRQDAISAQATCPSASGTGDQVSRTPRVMAATLALGQHHPGGPEALDLDDLAVMADARHLHLMSISRNRPVEPVVLNAIEFTRAAHPLLRFLAEVTTARVAVTSPFSWGAAGHLPFLPRLRWQRCVLAPARWRLDARDLPRSTTPWRQWADHLDQWRRTHHVPATVQIGEGDQRPRLDLKRPAHRQLLRDQLDRLGHVNLREAPTDRDLGWIDGRAHEITTTVTSTVPPLPVRRRPGSTSVHPRPEEHLPGGKGWLSLKLYGHAERATFLITRQLPRLAEAGAPGPWWFLRYRDPDPHLRVRIRIDEPGHTETVHAWTRGLREQGLVADVRHDTYVPETGRFGPGTAMGAAEDLFVADSAAVLAQLAYAPDQAHVWAAASMTDLAHHVLGSGQAARSWLIEHVPRTAPPRDQAARAIALMAPTTAHPAPIRQAWRERAQAAHAYTAALAKIDADASDLLADLLHLHTARIFGPAPETELQCLALARTAALSVNARWKATP